MPDDTPEAPEVPESQERIMYTGFIVTPLESMIYEINGLKSISNIKYRKASESLNAHRFGTEQHSRNAEYYDMDKRLNDIETFWRNLEDYFNKIIFQLDQMNTMRYRDFLK